MNQQDLWKTVLGEIELQISRPNFLTWFKNSQLIKKEEHDGVVFSSLPNNFAREWVKNRYHKIILSSLRTNDSSVKNIEYVVASSNIAQGIFPHQKNKL